MQSPFLLWSLFTSEEKKKKQKSQKQQYHEVTIQAGHTLETNFMNGFWVCL